MSLLDASNDFVQLSKNIGEFKEVLCKEKNIGIKSQDIRLVTLDGIQQYLMSLSFYIRCLWRFQEGIRHDNPLLDRENFIKLLNQKLGFNLSEEQLDGPLGIIYVFPIRALIVMVHFQIDSYLTEITNSNEGFYTKVNNSSLSKEHKDALFCLGYYRNTFHSSGLHKIHRSKWIDQKEPQVGEIDREFIFGDDSIIFKHKEAVTLNKWWKTATTLIEESVESLKSLILNN